MTFDELKQRAQSKQCRLVRAKDSGGLAKSGYVVWNRRDLWKRCATLQDVAKYLDKQKG